MHGATKYEMILAVDIRPGVNLLIDLRQLGNVMLHSIITVELCVTIYIGIAMLGRQLNLYHKANRLHGMALICRELCTATIGGYFTYSSIHMQDVQVEVMV